MVATGNGERDLRLALESLRNLGEFESSCHEQFPCFLLLAGMSHQRLKTVIFRFQTT